MGNDGGTVSNARKIVVKRKKVRREQGTDEKREVKWGSCALSGDPLSLPLVIDLLGHLMNQEAAMRFFLKQLPNPAFGHLKKFKRDVLQLKVVRDSGSTSDGAPVADTRSFYAAGVKALFRCPITLHPADGSRQFVALWPCGHVFSLEGMQQFAGPGGALPSGEQHCPSCSAKYGPDDVIEINPRAEVIPRLQAAMARRKASWAAARKAKRAGGTTASESAGVAAGGGGGGGTSAISSASAATTADGASSSSSSAGPIGTGAGTAQASVPLAREGALAGGKRGRSGSDMVAGGDSAAPLAAASGGGGGGGAVLAEHGVSMGGAIGDSSEGARDSKKARMESAVAVV